MQPVGNLGTGLHLISSLSKCAPGELSQCVSSLEHPQERCGGRTAGFLGEFNSQCYAVQIWGLFNGTEVQSETEASFFSVLGDAGEVCLLCTLMRSSG